MIVIAGNPTILGYAMAGNPTNLGWVYGYHINRFQLYTFHDIDTSVTSSQLCFRILFTKLKADFNPTYLF